MRKMTDSRLLNLASIMKTATILKTGFANWKFTICLIFCQKRRRSCLLLTIFMKKLNISSNQCFASISTTMKMRNLCLLTLEISKKRFIMCLRKLMKQWLLYTSFSILSNKSPHLTILQDLRNTCNYLNEMMRH